jgi:hypothetical protein
LINGVGVLRGDQMSRSNAGDDVMSGPRQQFGPEIWVADDGFMVSLFKPDGGDPAPYWDLFVWSPIALSDSRAWAYTPSGLPQLTSSPFSCGVAVRLSYGSALRVTTAAAQAQRPYLPIRTWRCS